MNRNHAAPRSLRRLGFGNRKGLGAGGAVLLFVFVVIRCYGIYYRSQARRERTEAQYNVQQPQVRYDADRAWEQRAHDRWRDRAERARQQGREVANHDFSGHDAGSSRFDRTPMRRFGRPDPEPEPSVPSASEALGQLGLPSIDSIPLPAFPELANPRKYLVNGDHQFTWFDVTLKPTVSPAAPGQEMQLRVHVPHSDGAFERRPLVLVPPDGTNLVQGAEIESGEPENRQVLEFVEAGFVVVSYSLDGARPDLGPSHEEMAESYKQFLAAHAGLVNARNALEYALEQVVHVDPKRIFTAGRNTAGTLSLLHAAHEPRLTGCIAFAPVTNLQDDEDMQTLRRHPDADEVLPNLESYSLAFAPVAVADRIRCPVFLFHAADDSVVPLSNSLQMKAKLPSTPVVLLRATEGDHHDAMVRVGLPAAVKWINALTKDSEPDEPAVAVAGPDTTSVTPPPEPANVQDRITPLQAAGPSAVAQLRTNMRNLSGTWRDRANRKIFLDVVERERLGGVVYHLVVRYAERLPNGRWRLDAKGNNVYSEAEAVLATNRLNQLVADVGGRTTLVLNAGLLVVQGPSLQGVFSRVRR